MRVPSTTAKPLFSPGGGRRRDLPPPPPPTAVAPPSLSTSHSRRLRGSGSLKGAHSPMFAAVVAAGAPGRRRGYAFEAVEPSSPKVTCIGQVRVKSKKKKKRKGTLRSGSKRAIGGEVSLRRREEEEEEEEYYCNNQGWACQIRASICEALKGAVSELNCFVLPCVGRSKPIGEEEEEAKRRRSSVWSCGAALARWVMAVEESEERGLGGGEVVEVVVEEKIRRRGAVSEAVAEAEAEAEAEVEVEVVEIEEKGRVSVCVPPRNALLLMRCRSDPVRIAALESKFWGSPATKGQVDDDDDDDDDDDEEDDEDEDDDEREKEYDNVDGEETNQVQEDGSMEAERGHLGVVLSTGDSELGYPIEGNEPTMHVERAQGGGKEANEEAVKIQLQGEAEAEMEFKEEEEEEEEEEGKDEEVKAEDERKSSLPVQWQRCDSSSREEKRRQRRRWRWRHSISSEREAKRRSFSNEEEKRRASFSVDCQVRQCWSFYVDQKEDLISKLNASAGLELEKEKECSSEPELAKENLQEQAHVSGNEGTEATSKVDEAQEAKREDELKEEEEVEVEEEERDKCGGDRLPDCLLLMMYEPKLSMEVSKETWVSSKHFLHWHPHHRPRHPSDDGGANGAEVKTDEECEKCGGGDGEDSDSKEAIVAVNPASPPPPPAALTLQVVEQKLKPMVQTLYQPLVLTRCKSEPMRSAARLVPDACFWKDRYRPIGAAGIGF